MSCTPFEISSLLDSPGSPEFLGYLHFPHPQGILSLALDGETPHLASCILGAAFTLLTVRRLKRWLCTSVWCQYARGKNWKESRMEDWRRAIRDFLQLFVGWSLLALMLNNSTQSVYLEASVNICEHPRVGSRIPGLLQPLQLTICVIFSNMFWEELCFLETGNLLSTSINMIQIWACGCLQQVYLTVHLACRYSQRHEENEASRCCGNSGRADLSSLWRGRFLIGTLLEHSFIIVRFNSKYFNCILNTSISFIQIVVFHFQKYLWLIFPIFSNNFFKICFLFIYFLGLLLFFPLFFLIFERGFLFLYCFLFFFDFFLFCFFCFVFFLNLVFIIVIVFCFYFFILFSFLFCLFFTFSWTCLNTSKFFFLEFVPFFPMSFCILF